VKAYTASKLHLRVLIPRLARPYADTQICQKDRSVRIDEDVARLDIPLLCKLVSPWAAAIGRVHEQSAANAGIRARSMPASTLLSPPPPQVCLYTM
jgi:hypothetical protein